jgi:hypothetical protein
MRSRLGGPPSLALHGAPDRRAGKAGGDRGRGAADRLTLALLAGALSILVLACHDPAREAAERDARDHARLERIVSADELFDRALKAADDASRAGDDEKAASLLEGAGARAAAEAIAEAEREPLETPWARTRRDALVAVLRDRGASMPGYAQALRGEDLDAKLAAVQAQVALQQRALDVASAAVAAPGPLASP